jgi:monoamine oxidase
VKIAVAGAGPAGLQAAWLLELAGHDVTVFEARARVGGRLETTALANGFYESGAEWIDADHRRVLALIRSFGLEPQAEQQWPGRLLKNGEFAPEDSPWPDAAADAEAVHEAAAGLASRIPATPWSWEQAEEMDLQTLGEFLDHHCISPRGRWLCEAVQRSDEGEDPARVGLLGWLVGYRHYLAREEGDMSLYRIPGGAQGLCEKMAARLKRPPVLERAVRSVETHDGHVEIWMDGEMAFADRLVMALPVPALQAVEFFPDLEMETEAAWHGMGMARAIKVAFEFDRPFWEDHGPARLLADLPFQQIWSGGQDGAHVLTAYICGDQAERIGGQVNPVPGLLKALDEALPGAAAAFRNGWVHNWISDPWAGGAFSSLPPGSVQTSLPHLRRPIGRIHFAGEHTANWMGFIEGALESAERVAQEIQHAE